MIAGRQRHHVRFWRAVDTQDDATGEPVRTWESIGYVWAKFEEQRGTEGEVADGVEAKRETPMLCRYSSQLAAVTEKDRIEFGGRYYNIAAIDHVGMNKREIRFACRSGPNAG